MATKHMSMRGDIRDMERLRMAHGDQPAVGNAQVNARGDRLGPGGVVMKTQEQIESEWAAAKARMDAMNAKPVDLKSKNKVADALANLAPKVKPSIAADDQGFDPAAAPAAPAAPRRRVVDSE